MLKCTNNNSFGGGGNLLEARCKTLSALQIRQKLRAFTLTEVLISVAIIGIIAALIIPAIQTKYQLLMLDRSFTRQSQAISYAVDALAVTENKASFFDTFMYSDSTPSSYEQNAGAFLKKYLRVAKYCGDSNGSCFASKYYEYKEKDKVLYSPIYEGACATLKNGSSICLTPQIGGQGVNALIDLNGPKGPNILGTDLRSISLSPKTRTVISTGAEPVLSLNNPPIETGTPPCTTCDCDPTLPGCYTIPTLPVCTNPDPSNSSRCCDTAIISNYTDSCCTLAAIKNSNVKCKTSTSTCAHGNIDIGVHCSNNKCTSSIISANAYDASNNPISLYSLGNNLSVSISSCGAVGCNMGTPCSISSGMNVNQAYSICVKRIGAGTNVVSSTNTPSLGSGFSYNQFKVNVHCNWSF